MKQIPLDRVKRDNSNIRKFDDSLWRALRKERFKKAVPDMFTNEMAAEHQAIKDTPNHDFDVDVEHFINSFLSAQEAKIFRLFVYGGKIRQVDIGAILGVSQPTVTMTLARVLPMFKEYYYPDFETKEACCD